MKVLIKLRFSVKSCILAAFVASAFVPPYVQQATSVSEMPSQDLSSGQFLLVEEGFVMKTASISESGHRLAYSKGISHVVGTNESVNSIADLYNISANTVRWANNLDDKTVLHPGDVLLILPVDGVLHTVKRGQSLLKIAMLYDADEAAIERQNHLTNQKIYAGQQIIIPGGRPIVKKKPIGLKGVLHAKNVRKSESETQRQWPPPEAIPPASNGVLQKPCDCTYTQKYHPGHYAVDMARQGGGPIFAAEDGVIIRADYGWNGGYGNVIEIDHGGGLVTLYAHNKKLYVREGSVVRRGDVISAMGNTGRVYGRTGIHLHFEVIMNGIKKNPLLYLQ